MSDKNNFERLKDFVNRRKNSILKEVPNTISLRSITERLKLDFGHIKRLYDYKIKTIKNDEKYIKLAKSIIINELL